MINTCIFIPDDEVVLPAADSEFVFGGAVPAGWEFSRSVAALSRGGDGRWATYPINTPRSYHDPITKANQGTLIEPQRTNLIYSSRPLVSTAKAVTVTADTTTQTPFGIGATRMVDNATVGAHGFDLIFGASGRAAAIADNSVVSIQITLKPIGTQTRGIFFCQQKSGVYKTVEFTTAGAGSIVSHSVQAARIDQDTDGFFRLQWTLNYAAGTNLGGANLTFQQDDGTRSYAGDGTRGFLIAHMGAEVGPECTSPIISSNAASNTPITRTEDVLTSQADWLTIGAKSFGIDYTPLSADPQVIFSAVGADQVEVSHESGQTLTYSAFAAGATIGPLRGEAPLPGVARSVIITAGFQEYWLAQNGKRLTFAQVGFAPNSLDAVRVGARAGGGIAGPMLIRRVKYWANALDREVAADFSADLSVPGVTPILPVLEIQANRTVPPETSIFLQAVTLGGEPSGVTFSYRTIDGTAKAGIDYTAISGTVVMEPGDSIWSITVPLLTRSLQETRTFSIEIHSPIGAKIGNAVCVFTLTKATPTAHAPLKLVNFDAPLSADWALTRSTQGWTRGADGIWGPVPANQPRIHYTSPTEVGILLEPASSQCLFESAYFGYLLNSTKTNVTQQAPVGNRVAQWRENVTNGNHLFRAAWNTTAATWPTGDFILWGIIKPVGPRTRYRFSIKGIDNVFGNAIFEMTGNGSVVSTSAANVIGYIEPEPFWPGWYRVGVAKTQAVSANVIAEFDIGPLDPATNSTTVAGNTAYGLDMCHFQCEAGLFWTSPIPVNATTAATPRAADVLKAAGGWQARESFALGVKFMRLGASPASQRIVQFRDVSPAVDDFGFLIADGSVRAPLTTGGTFHGNINGPANTPKVAQTALVSIDTNRYGVFVGGVKAGETAMTGKPMPRQVEHLRFGSKEQDGSQGAPILLMTAAYWTLGLSDDEGTVFSADLSGIPPGEVEPEPLPVINVPATLEVVEGQAITVPITKIGNGACSVNFRTESQTASYNVDYTGIGNRNPAAADARIITFAANESTKLVTVQTITDSEPEANDKFGITVEVFNDPPDCALGQGVGVVTIVDPVVPVDAAIYSRDKGFATEANCGEGRAWYVVTNLNDSGAGSLRDALSASNRNIVFEVGGTIMLQSHITGTISNVTVNGETAPYPGIIIQKYELQVRGSDLRYTHLTLERGHDGTTYGVDNGDCVKVNPGNGTVGLYTRSNIHFDHCLFLWSQDEMVEIWPWNANLSNITFSNCYFAEALWKPQTVGNYAAHKKVADGTQTQHNYGLIIGFGTKTTDVQNCVFADMDMRFPFIDHSTSVVLANNISFNCTKGATIQQNRDPLPKERMLVTCRGYLCISGPQSTAHSGFRFHSTAGTGNGTTFAPYYYAGTRVCVSNLYGWKGGSSTSTYITPGTAVERPFGTPICLENGATVNVETNTPPIDIPGSPVSARTADQIYTRATQNCGPLPKNRFGHATRVINKLKNKAGQWVNHESEVGGRSAPISRERKLNGTTTFPDGTTIPARPAAASGSTAPTATQIADAKAWVNLFRKQVQFDFD
jgi:hypothetical protein